MTTKKNTNRRSQAQKARNVRDNSTTLAMSLDPRGGLRGKQALATDYRRKPKHVKRGWDD